MSHARTLWEEGEEPGQQVVLLGVACALTAVVVDLMLGSGLGWVFDLSFVLLCVVLALRVRYADFFVVGVVPPLLMLVLFVFLAFVQPEALGAGSERRIQAVVNGLASHAWALLVGYLLCLVLLSVRHNVLTKVGDRG